MVKRTMSNEIITLVDSIWTIAIGEAFMKDITAGRCSVFYLAFVDL